MLGVRHDVEVGSLGVGAIGSIKSEMVLRELPRTRRDSTRSDRVRVLRVLHARARAGDGVSHDGDVVRALTLIRPMSAAIVHGTKRIENRPTNLPKSMRGVPTIVAVHAGKKWSDEYANAVSVIMKTRELNCEQGIVGLMRLTGRVFTVDDPPGKLYRFALTGEPTRSDGRLEPDAWWSGPFGYEIDRAVAFEKPIECSGMMGFWPVPPHALAVMNICGACGWHHRKGEPITGCVLR